MTDMLVKLYNCPLKSRNKKLVEQGIVVKRALAIDTKEIVEFVQSNFNEISTGWADECKVSLFRQPSSCFIAIENENVVGFCCYDATAKGMLGPLGVRLDCRGKGVAQELMFQCFEAMKADGYVYAVIGWVSTEEFYAKHCGAITIENSSPGVYARMVKNVENE